MPGHKRALRRFVEATGHVTFAEIPPNPADYPGALPHMLYAGSLVFVKPAGPVDLGNFGNWWTFMRGADWRHPTGAQSLDRAVASAIRSVTSPSATPRRSPVGQVSCPPRRSGSSPRAGVWKGPSTHGTSVRPAAAGTGANTWQGEFPWQNLLVDRYEGHLAGGRLSREWLRRSTT